ncbi:EAL domain-containing protein [Mariniblastus fucicola]|uniref:Cyclic-di-GMP phosphodiesterase AdrB n=1 Tax=Mariniblastus fucicola TaxID=980251 RepID=A0A5B9PIR2_9BACT|nr:EAL domain-containing protein [Mariniblastus fucicola]QEG24576.1 Putative cyclic-di-GMP phosphodiesterase AdrB [Mariniblastus fucicola]
MTTSKQLQSANPTPEVFSGWFLSGQVDESEPLRKFPVHSDPFTVGRQSDSSLCLPTGCISKNHAELTFRDDGTLILRDLGSTNGTYVNGEVITGDTVVNEDDIIQFATIVFRIGSDDVESVGNTIAEDVCDQALAIIQFERLISDGGLYPHFQPIVTLADQKRIGYEVLGRSRLFGLQSPHEMFTAASQLNMEAQLSEAFRQRGVEIGTAFGSDCNLFVNTHPKELDRTEFYESLKTLRESAPDQAITLEIHEAASTNLTMMRELCAFLKDYEIHLAFDDFGVGRARLVELGEVRPDYLKFDMKLTKNIEMAPPSRQELVALFANMVNSLGIKTLAEGVETRECHEILVEMGFQLGQGYYYGRPSPISKYTKSDSDPQTDPDLIDGGQSTGPIKIEEI